MFNAVQQLCDEFGAVSRLNVLAARTGNTNFKYLDTQ